VEGRRIDKEDRRDKKHMKIVINRRYGGFRISREARELYCKYSLEINKVKGEYHDFDVDRTDPILIRVVEELGDKANGGFAELKIVEVPDDVRWTIKDYDGIEWVAEVHRTWE